NRSFFFEKEPEIEDFLLLTTTKIEAKEGEQLFAFAGVPLMPLSRKISQAGFSGLEFCAGIPATVGGAVWMNAGAHGEEIAKVITKVLLVLPSGELRLLNNSEIEFNYRTNSLPTGSLVLGAQFQFILGETAEIEQRRTHCLEYRKRTQPL